MPIERQAHRATSFEDAARYDREQHWQLKPEERLEIAKILRERAYPDAPDVRESERAK